MKKLFILVTFLSIVLIVPTKAQSKKDKIAQLITLSMSEKSIDKAMSIFDKMLDEISTKSVKNQEEHASSKSNNKSTLTFQEPEVLKDSVIYKKKQKVKLVLKEFMSDMFIQMKKESVPLYDSLFTETQIDKQLSFFQSEAGKKQLKEGLDYMNSSDFMSLIKGDSLKEIHKFSVGKKQKIDSVITLVMPKDFMKYFDTKSSMMKTMAKEMSGQLFSNEKDSIKRKEMIKGFDSVMTANQNNPKLNARQDSIMNIYLNKSIAKLEVFYDKRFTENDLDQMIIYYSNPEVKEMNKKKTILNGIMMQRLMSTELPKFMGKIMKEFMPEMKMEHKEI